MSTPKQAEVLKSIFARLSTDPGISTVVGNRVYNHVPQQAVNLPAKPYLRFFLVTSVDWGPKNELGYDMEIQVDIWSEQRGDEEALTIMDKVIAATHNNNLLLSSGEAILLQHAGSNIIEEADGITHHGVIRLRTLTGQT